MCFSKFTIKLFPIKTFYNNWRQKLRKICVRFVDKSNDICEEFLEIGRCTQVNGEAISNNILQIIKKVDLNIMNCHGQG